MTFLNVLDNFKHVWLNVRVVRTLSRMLLVVAMLLLLPVMMAGATYGLPGAGGVSCSCCALHHCCGHEWQAGPEHDKCVEHGHRYHYHERMQLMRENARRADISAPVVVEESASRGTPSVLVRCAPRGITSVQGLPRMYGGYLRPHRC